MEIVIYDFEVFKEDWMVVIKTLSDPPYLIHNDPELLRDVYNAHKEDVWIGYNNNHYDQYILHAILAGNTDLKTINDSIIVKGIPGWKIDGTNKKEFTEKQFDVALAADGGLKKLEGMMGKNIKETSIPFDINRKLTTEEVSETFLYCLHDVNMTEEILIHRKNEFHAIRSLIRQFGLPGSDVCKTKVQLSAKILGAEKDPDVVADMWDVKIPASFSTIKYRDVRDWFLNPENQVKEQKYITKTGRESTRSPQLVKEMAGLKVTFAWGGVHAAKEHYHAKGYFLNMDVASLYPSIDILHPEDCFSRAVDESGLQRYKDIKKVRLQLKAEGKKKEQAPYKIVLNGTYGAMKDRNNALYDPRGGSNTCVYGQLLVGVDLFEKLEDHCEIIQVNTDGILVRLEKPEDQKIIREIADDWQTRTGLDLDFDDYGYGEIWQKDVNNYVIKSEDGHYKSKGAFVKQLGPLDYDLPIVNKALIDYMVNGIPIETTINECDELKEFQMISHASSKFDGFRHGDEDLPEKTVRIFASVNPADGGIAKRKGLSLNKVSNSPYHTFIVNDDVNDRKCDDRLDRQWYIDLAYKRLSGFGVKVNKDGIFKAGVPTAGKVPKSKLKKNPDLKSVDETLAESEEASGILSDNIVLIDFDDAEESAIAQKIVQDLNVRIDKSKRGQHHFWINDGNITKNGNHLKLGCGLTADIKIGLDRISLASLKRDGKELEVIQDPVHLDKVPYYMLPNTKAAKLAEQYIEGTEGVRNTLLSQWSYDLQVHGVDDATVNELGLILNDLCKEPLKESEVANCTRKLEEEKILAYQDRIKFLDENGHFSKAKMGNYLIEEYDMRIIDGQICIHENGVYKSGENIVGRLAQKCFEEISEPQKKNVYGHIWDKLEHEITPTASDLVAFKNCIFDVREMREVQDDGSFILFNRIPHDYKPDAYDEATDKCLDSLCCHNQQIRTVLEELIGYCLLSDNRYQTAGILTGRGANGKSTFLNAVQNMLGTENYSSLDLQGLGERFSTVQLFHKLANIGDDIPSDFIDGKTEATFKKVTANGSITAEYKCQQTFKFIPYATQIFSANVLPRVKSDGIDAWIRRMIIIPFNARFTPDSPDYDSSMPKKVTTKASAEYMIKIGVNAIHRVIQNDRFTMCADVDQMGREYKMANDSVMAFMEETGVEGVINREVAKVYSSYRVFCEGEGTRAINRNTFGKRLKSDYGIESKQKKDNGKNVRVYVLTAKS